MATIMMVRHGQASFGTDNYDQLSTLGQRQADLMGEYFRDTGVVFDAAYSGQLSRQRETCQRVLASQPSAVENHIDPRFDEVRNDEQVNILFPLLAQAEPRLAKLMESAMQDSKHYQKIIEAVFTDWVTREEPHPDIQSWQEYSGGVMSGLSDVMRNEGAGKTVGIFTSGGTVATATALVLGVGADLVYRFYEPVINCSVTQFFYSGDKISLSHFNDHSILHKLSATLGERLVTYR
ncbi:MAG: phosphoglycerate mutase family protein [Halieaceae bacterium]|nr:phosphoglycerate mutase family protein [Halieaceae bacterium]